MPSTDGVVACDLGRSDAQGIGGSPFLKRRRRLSPGSSGASVVLAGQKIEDISDLRMKHMRQHRNQALLKRQKSEETPDKVVPRIQTSADTVPSAPPSPTLLKRKMSATIAPRSPLRAFPPSQQPLCQLLQPPRESDDMWMQELLKPETTHIVCGSPVRSSTKAKPSTTSPLLKRHRRDELKPSSGPSGRSTSPTAKQDGTAMSSGQSGLPPSPVAAGGSPSPAASGLSPSPVARPIEASLLPEIPVPKLPAAAPSARHDASSAGSRFGKVAPHKSARLLRLELENFGVFEKELISLEGGSVACVVGPNSSGKSTLSNAIRFVCLCGEPLGCAKNLVRLSEPPCEAGLVTAQFSSTDGGEHMLRREARADSSPGRFWVAGPAEHAAWREVSAEEYKAYLTRDLRWGGDSVILPQFALLESCGAAKLLEMLPEVLSGVGGGAQPSGGPLQKLLKRKTGPSGSSGGAIASVSARSEAWLTRRVDEIYRELSRVPLDDRMQEWGEGGQAVLRRRAAGGGLSVTVSQRRGAAGAGCGTPLESMSDGDQDLVALAILLALPGLRADFSDAPPAFVLLDEPDSRLDRRHSKALLRFLKGPLGPGQSVVLSLNNHNAFDGSSIVHEMEVQE